MREAGTKGARKEADVSGERARAPSVAMAAPPATPRHRETSGKPLARLACYLHVWHNESEAGVADEKSKDCRDKRNGEANPEYDNFQEVLEQVPSVRKEELDKRRAEYERKRKEKRAG